MQLKVKVLFLLIIFLACKNELLAQLSFGEAFDGYIKKAELAYEQGSYELAGNYYDTALNIKNGKYPLSGYYGDALKAWIKAANTDQSFFYLEKLVTEGWLSIHDFNNSEYFQLLPQDSRWHKIAAIINWKDELYGQVRNQLEKIRNEDQALRRILSCAKDQFREDTASMAYFFDLMKHQDSLNLHHVERIIQQYGWLGATNVGDKANRTLWLIIQHASLEKQDQYIPMIKQSVLSGETRPSELAFLQDRIAYERMEKQLYGTQIVSISETGLYKIYPIQDPEYVDQRRQEIGLEPLHSYLSFFGITEISIKSLDDPSVFDYLKMKK